jgi:hypothetical protein
MFRLQVLGDLAIYHRDGTRIGEARRKPLAVLAYLAAEAPRAVNRELLAGLLWPESTPEKARRSLAQTLYTLRRELGADVVQGVSQLTLDVNLVGTDLADFREALARHDVGAAAVHYGGPFLDGMYVAGTAEFERWSEGWRERLAARHAEVCGAMPAVDPIALRPLGGARPALSSLPAPSARRLPAFATRAMLLTGMVAIAAMAVVRYAPKPPAAPLRVTDLPISARERWTLDRRARIDSAHIGRILLLPTQIINGDSTAGAISAELQASLQSAIAQTFTGAIAGAAAERVQAQVLKESEGWPTTTSLQIARMMALTGTDLAVQPTLRLQGDSSYVKMIYHRSVAKTPQARPRLSNLESLAHAGLPLPPSRPAIGIGLVRRETLRFVRSLERCDPDLHADITDAPWCWSEGRTLIVPEGSAGWLFRKRWEEHRRRVQGQRS